MELPSIREIVNKYELNAKKNFGQNFLFDLNITDKIVRAAGDLSNHTVIEVGPGPGALTRSILKANPKKLIAIDMDSRCIAVIKDYLLPAYPDKLEIIEQDALRFDMGKIEGRIKIIANLPYNISTKLLLGWLDNLSKIDKMVLMFQKEVAERLVASPCSKDYGRLSVKTQWLCDVEKEFDLSPQNFFPPPKVTSTVVSICPYKKPLFNADAEVLEKICAAVFSQRRKMLKVSLKQLSDNPVEILERAGIDEKRRPEELSVEEFCKLSQVFTPKKGK